MRRLLTRSLLAIAALILLSGVVLYWYLRQSLPAIDGQLRVQGLAASVDIIRNTDGIPHIFGTSKADVFFGLGFVHAQDRLWQMELQRRIGHGRLSEVFGSATV